MTALIKCVVWDIDNTLLDGVYLESTAQPPPADQELLGVLRELAGRGILHAIASRNPPQAVQYVRQLTGVDFAAAECGWGSKAESVGRIAAELGLAPDSMAFVDDDLAERAEVSAAWPAVLVLSPQDAAEAADWPQFSPAVVTAEASRRGAMYAERRRRQAAAGEFAGSRDDFLRQAGTRITIGPAVPADVPRLHELTVRTHQLNSAGQPRTEAALASVIGSADQQLVTVTLADDYGDDGLVGGAILARNVAGPAPVPSSASSLSAGAPPVPMTAPLVMMSCRALGRGALDALLAWLCRLAAAGGAAELQVPCLVTERNVPMRLALAAAGFRAAPDSIAPDGRAIFARSLTGELPPLADWVTGR